MPIKFECMNHEPTPGTEFGKPTFIKYGKEIDIQEYIESGREDTEIMPCLLKYGCLKPMERTAEAVYGDFTEYNDLRGNLEKATKIKEMWDQMPNDLKNKFNNDMHEFADKGENWAKEEIAKAQADATTTPETPTETTTGEQ